MQIQKKSEQTVNIFECLNCNLLDKDLRCEIYDLPKVRGHRPSHQRSLWTSPFTSFPIIQTVPDISRSFMFFSDAVAVTWDCFVCCSCPFRSLSTTTMSGWLANSCLTVRNLKSLRMFALLFSTNFLWFTRCSTCTGSVGV